MLPLQSSPSPHSRLLPVRSASSSRSPHMAHSVFLAISRRMPPGVPFSPRRRPCRARAARPRRLDLSRLSVDRRPHHSSARRRRGRGGCGRQRWRRVHRA
ncbi:hypothetical protein ZWY2020_057711 [Hordeum vulgare]|nr:hypothetical protein ZWY2020_057711 [Hordeum vulgare]